MPYDLIESHLKHWDELFATRGWGRYPPEELVRFMAREFGSMADRSAISVLEIGCGPGPNLWYLAREGYAIAGIDGAPTALEQARARLRQEGLERAAQEVDLKQGNFAELPWPDASFDVVIDIEAIYANTMDVIRKTVDEAYRVLKPRGAMFAKMFGTETSGFGTGEEIEPGGFREPTAGPCAGHDIAHFFTREELGELFSAFGHTSLGWVSRSDAEGHGIMFEWLVSARK